jgi:CDGSH-type Zn-finger protein
LSTSCRWHCVRATAFGIGISDHAKQRPADKDGTAALCQCKGTGNQPFCDGTHAQLGEAAVGDPAGAPT